VLQRDHSSVHLLDVIGPYRRNVATLTAIQGHVARGEDDAGDKLGPVAGRLQAKVGVELAEAGVDYGRRAARSLLLATLGSAGMIIALVALFGVFYLRSHKEHATAQRLARENAALLVEDSQLQVIQRLALAGAYRDDDTGQHTARVGELSARIGEALGLHADEVLLLRQAAPLHDVGKIAIPDSILLKPGRLTQDEFERMKAHTSFGAAMLSGAGFALREMAETIALTHERPYKAAWSVADAVAEIKRQRGRQFDPRIVDAFAGVIAHAEPETVDRLAVVQA
jgi:hypothetical protein